MNKKSFLLASVCVMATLIISRAALHISSTDQPVQAKQASETQTSAAPKWEYCAITSVFDRGDNFGRWKGTAIIHYFQASGSKDEIVEITPAPEINKKYPYISAREEARFKAIAKLGDEGWEMILKEPDKDRVITPLYFKRPKQ